MVRDLHFVSLCFCVLFGQPARVVCKRRTESIHVLDQSDVDSRGFITASQNETHEDVEGPVAPEEEAFHFVFTRHGLSVNNLISQGFHAKMYMKQNKAGTPFHKCLSGEGQSCGSIQDTCLSDVGSSHGTIKAGRDEMIDVGKQLFGDERIVDKFNFFSATNFVKAQFSLVIVSPLRRTLETAMQIFGPIANSKNIPFIAEPWAHEKRNGDSDVALKRSDTCKFVSCMATTLVQMSSAQEPVKSLQASLSLLPEEWSTDSTIPSADVPYYPPSSKTDKRCSICKRMAKLRTSLWSTMKEKNAKAAFVVTHSGVIRFLLQEAVRGGKPDNGAMVYAKLVKTTSRQGPPRLEFRDIQLLRDKLPDAPASLPAWLREPTDVALDSYCADHVFKDLRVSAIGFDHQDFSWSEIHLQDGFMWLEKVKFGGEQVQGRLVFARKEAGGGLDIEVTAHMAKDRDLQPCDAWHKSYPDWGNGKYAKIKGQFWSDKNHSAPAFVVISYKKSSWSSEKQKIAWRQMMDVLC